MSCILLDEYIEVPITARNVNHYKLKGYDIPMKYSEKSKKEVIDTSKKIKVKVEHLPESSHIKIRYACDNCGRECITEYATWTRTTYPELGDLCKECAIKIKLPQAIQDKYGADNCAKVSSIIDKKKQTNLSKYGNEWAIASNKVRETIIQSYLDNFGVDNPMKNEEVKERAKNTNNKKYGGNCSICDERVRQKSKETCLRKYGVSNAFQSKEIQEKARKTLYKNGNTPSSLAEKKLCCLLENIFGKDKCFPNYPVGNLSLDCLVIIGEHKIDFEYDGFYWHKNRAQKDAARNAVLMNEGYKIIRVKANNRDTLPTEERILQAVDYLVKDNHSLTFIDMNT